MGVRPLKTGCVTLGKAIGPSGPVPSLPPLCTDQLNQAIPSEDPLILRPLEASWEPACAPGSFLLGRDWTFVYPLTANCSIKN